jgi:hypothetical protein
LLKRLSQFVVFLYVGPLCALSIPHQMMNKITCEIDAQIAKKWALSEINYTDDKENLKNSIEIFFEKTTGTELNILCHKFVEQTLTEAFINISQINPGLVRDTFEKAYSKVNFKIVDFCEHRGSPIFAAACFKKNFFWETQQIHMTSFHKDIVMKMFFPDFKIRFTNEKSKLALVHEFFHYFAWDQIPFDQHSNPYRYESEDPVYACMNMAFPGHSMIYKHNEKSSVLEKQAETCRNHRL